MTSPGSKATGAIAVALARSFLGIIFLLAGLSKTLHPYDFLGGVYAYELVGPKLGMAVAVTLPPTELLVGIGLLGGVFMRGNALLACAMSLVFVVVQFLALKNGLDVSCSCFGSLLPDEAGTINYFSLMRVLGIFLCSCFLVRGVWIEWCGAREASSKPAPLSGGGASAIS